MEKLKLHKFKLRHMHDGAARISHWNSLKLVPQRCVPSFGKLDSESEQVEVSQDEPIQAQQRADVHPPPHMQISRLSQEVVITPTRLFGIFER